MLNILAELGGIFNSFYLIGFAFTISFSYNLMMSSLIRKLYQFKATEEELRIQQGKSKKGQKKQPGKTED